MAPIVWRQLGFILLIGVLLIGCSASAFAPLRQGPERTATVIIDVAATPTPSPPTTITPTATPRPATFTPTASKSPTHTPTRTSTPTSRTPTLELTAIRPADNSKYGTAYHGAYFVQAVNAGRQRVQNNGKVYLGIGFISNDPTLNVAQLQQFKTEACGTVEDSTGHTWPQSGAGGIVVEGRITDLTCLFEVPENLDHFIWYAKGYPGIHIDF